MHDRAKACRRGLSARALPDLQQLRPGLGSGRRTGAQHLHRRCHDRWHLAAQAGRRERQFPPHLARGRRPLRRLWRRLGLRQDQHPEAGDRREPDHRRPARAQGAGRVGRQRPRRRLLLGGLERQVLGHARDRHRPPHVVHPGAAARAGLHRGAARHLQRWGPELAQGGLGIHRGGPDADAELPAARTGLSCPRAAGRDHRLCLQLPQPAHGHPRPCPDARPGRSGARAQGSNRRARGLPVLRRARPRWRRPMDLGHQLAGSRSWKSRTCWTRRRQ